MADFSTPFGSIGGNTRLPTVDERQDGFPCGPADRALFNGLLRRIEAEMNAIVQEGAITPSDSDDTTVLQAIQALIDAATGGGDTSGYVTMAQARARLPIYPEVLHADAHLNVTSPSTGQVRVPAGRTFLHRGIYSVTTVQTDIATLASKTYHLRWNPTDGFELMDVADSGYNPSTLLEANAAFDSAYDDMLVARVVTNSSNIADITNLKNLAALADAAVIAGTSPQLSGVNGANFLINRTLSWARTPRDYSVSKIKGVVTDGANDADFNFITPGPSRTDAAALNAAAAAVPVDRYGLAAIAMHDSATSLSVQFSARA